MQIDAPDYDARLGAYSELTQSAWAGMRATEALPLLHAALADMRNGEDLATRAAASQALSRLIAAAASLGGTDAAAGNPEASTAVEAGPLAEVPGAVPEGEVPAAGGTDESLVAGGDIRTVAERVLYLQLKRTLASPSLAVRQVSFASGLPFSVSILI